MYATWHRCCMWLCGLPSAPQELHLASSSPYMQAGRTLLHIAAEQGSCTHANSLLRFGASKTAVTTVSGLHAILLPKIRTEHCALAAFSCVFSEYLDITSARWCVSHPAIQCLCTGMPRGMLNALMGCPSMASGLFYWCATCGSHICCMDWYGQYSVWRFPAAERLQPIRAAGASVT